MPDTENHSDSSGIGAPLVFLGIGIGLILYPDAILKDEPWDKLTNKHAFAFALGLWAIGVAVGAHSHGYWGRRGFARVSFWGRLIGGWAAVIACIYVIWSLVEADGCPWG